MNQRKRNLQRRRGLQNFLKGGEKVKEKNPSLKKMRKRDEVKKTQTANTTAS